MRREMERSQERIQSFRETADERMRVTTGGDRFGSLDPGFVNRDQTGSHLSLPREKESRLLVGGLRKTTTPLKLCKFFDQPGVMTASMVLSDEWDPKDTTS